ncbi:MAG: hypothetical protein ACOH1T_06890 [Microbacteriaceae bacterium]
MIENRLESVAPELSLKLQSSDEEVLRRVAAGVVQWALDVVTMDSPAVTRAVGALQEKIFQDGPERNALVEVVENLDVIAWDIQDAIGVSTTYDQYVHAFRRARVVDALWSALSPNATEAALESVYEASIAVQDDEALRVVVERLLGQ